jgi:Cu2+-exporting ATPase
MQCEVVHALPGRLRLRVDDALLNGLAPRFVAFLSAQPGVEDVRLNERARSVVVRFDEASVSGDGVLATIRTVAPETLPSDVPEASGPEATGAALGLATAAGVCSMLGVPGLSLACLVGAAAPIFRRAVDVLRTRGTPNVDVLDAAATALLALRGELGAAAAMTWLVALGDGIRDLTVQRSHRAIESLFEGRERTAWLVVGATRRRVPIDTLRVGNEVVVYAGELVPVDGTIVHGRGAVDQKAITGESLPVVRAKGDEVWAGTALTDGKLFVRATRVGRDTEAAKIVAFVRHAPVRETRIQNYAEAFADRLVPWSFAAAGAAYAATGNVRMPAALLIVDFGTGIRVAAPTTVLAAIADAARRGILVKGGRHLERLAEVDAIVFDKTATLTRGAPAVVGVHAVDGVDTDAILIRTTTSIPGRAFPRRAPSRRRVRHPFSWRSTAGASGSSGTPIRSAPRRRMSWRRSVHAGCARSSC